MSRKTQTELADVTPTRSRALARTVRHVVPVAPFRGEARRRRPKQVAAPKGARATDHDLPDGLSPHQDLDFADTSFVEAEAVDDSNEEISVDDDGEHRPVEEEVDKAQAEVSSNFLAVYFREMAQLAVLKPDEEYETARRIGALELELWVRLLSFAPLSQYLLRVVERTIDNSLPEFQPLRQAAEQTLKSGQITDEALVAAATTAAEKLRKLDIDRIHVGVVLGEVKKIANESLGRIIDERVDVNCKDKAFRQHLRELGLIMRRVHRAKHDFVKANLRLVVSIARRFNHGRMPLPDLIQEGNIGLIKAVERYDYRRGYRFSTYASWWIRHAISRGLADKGRAVRLPVHMIDVYHRVARSKRELSGRLGRQPTNEELGESTGLAVQKIEKMRTYLLDQSFSLDRAVSEKDGRKFVDFIADESPASQPAEQLASALMTHELRQLLLSLKPIEADILRQRFGLDTDQELTLKEIGEKYNLSRERIRQLQEQALLKMKRALVRRDIA